MKVYLDTIGCRLNQAEIESYARQLHTAGHELVASSHEADWVIVNTCAVTSAAASDSRAKIRQAARSEHAQIVVTGCWSNLQPEQAAGLPGVRHVVPNLLKDRLVSNLFGQPQEPFDLEPVARTPVPGARLRTRAFIKVQDGCDNRCTFCVTTLARGAGRSRSIPEILSDVRAALQPGEGQAREIVLTGVHLGSWGHDFDAPAHLRDLIKSILAETETPRLRLSSLEPWDLDEAFFELWADPRVCRHLHLPLQSGSACTLRRMARKTTPASYASLLAAARRAIPDIAITTDIITGFPGESEAEFSESLKFVETMQFSGGHVFTYSARPGTAAARMPAQVAHSLRKERNAQIRAVLESASRRYQVSFLGQVLPVLWESATALDDNGWSLTGLTDNYLRVQAYAPQHLWNEISPVRLIAPNNEGLRGQLMGAAQDGCSYL